MGDVGVAVESVPDDLVLVDGLRAVLAERGVREVVVIERVPNRYSSTFASELVTVTCDGRTDTVFCKHGGDRPDDGTGHRRGVPYEAAVYRLLDGTRAPLPRSAGSFETPLGSTLVLEWLRDGKRLATPTVRDGRAGRGGGWRMAGRRSDRSPRRSQPVRRRGSGPLARSRGATLDSGALGEPSSSRTSGTL